MHDPAQQKVIERLRATGQLPAFVVSAGGKLPPPLQGESRKITRQVGRRKVEVNDQGAGGGT